jgi:hypothetical protein
MVLAPLVMALLCLVLVEAKGGVRWDVKAALKSHTQNQKSSNLSERIQSAEGEGDGDHVSWFPTGGSAKLPQNEPTHVFKSLRRKHKTLRSTDPKSEAGRKLRRKRKVGFYVDLLDVQEFSSQFVGERVALPSAMKRGLLNYAYHIPFAHMDFFCDSTRHFMNYLKTQRVEHKILDADGKQTFHYGECVISRDKLPLPSGEGDLFYDNLTPKEAAARWPIGGSDYGDYARMNMTCAEHMHFNNPRKRPTSSIPAAAFLLHSRDALVLKEGSVHSMTANLTEHFAPARGCYHCQAFLDGHYCDPNYGPLNGAANYPKFGKVLVLSQIQGNNYFHFVVENMPRIAIFLQDLLLPANRDIKVHVVGGVNGDESLIPAHSYAWLAYLGIEKERIVAGNIVAEEVFVPEGVGCGTPGDAFWQVNMIREQLLGRSYTKAGSALISSLSPKAGSTSGSTALSSAPRRSFRDGTILLLNRVKGGNRPGGDDQAIFAQREAAIKTIVAASGGMKGMQVKIFSDADTELMACIACTAKLFNSASIIIGVHGAGLSNMLFARAGTVLIEAAGFGNPLCYMDLAFTLGMCRVCVCVSVTVGAVLPPSLILLTTTHTHPATRS